jgi:hypothetical protein
MTRSAGGGAMPIWLVATAFVGALAALFGGYWDDAWHTERGRDSFFIAPHLFIYFGVAGVGSALGVWVATEARKRGLRTALAAPTVRLAAISVLATLASGPIDDLWHRAFGRDAVIWSPPHVLGIVGTMALGAALTAEVVRRGAVWAAAAGGLTLSAANFVVAEYDTDVPQFDVVWYLPALALSAGLALALVRQLNGRRWAATETAAAHLGFILLVDAFLLTQDFAGPALPLLLVPALALDLTWSRGYSARTRAGAFTVALFAVYVPVRNWLGDGVEFELADVVAGLPLAFLAVLPFAALGAGARTLRPSAPALAGFVLLLVLAVPVAVAWAHDPGQGEEAGAASLAVVAEDSRISMRGELRGTDCSRLTSGRLVARRAGVVRAAPLQLSGCSFSGGTSVDERGRWFVYAELQQEGTTLETWLPVHALKGTDRAFEKERFVYIPPKRSTAAGELVGGTLLYGAMLALLIMAFRLTRSPAARAA